MIKYDFYSCAFGKKRSRIFISLTVFLAVSSVCAAQTNFKLGKYEKRWALFHPCAALKLKKHKSEMLATYNEVKDKKLLDAFENGGKLDAFRHVFAMSYFSKYISVKKLRKLGRAHEKGNYLQYLKGKNDEGGELPDSLLRSWT